MTSTYTVIILPGPGGKYIIYFLDNKGLLWLYISATGKFFWRVDESSCWNETCPNPRCHCDHSFPVMDIVRGIIRTDEYRIDRMGDVFNDRLAQLQEEQERDRLLRLEEQEHIRQEQQQLENVLRASMAVQ